MATLPRFVPGDPVLDVSDKDVALTGIYQGRRRMTLTYPAINRARQTLWVVTGSEKTEMLRRLREKEMYLFPPGGFAAIRLCCWPTKAAQSN